MEPLISVIVPVYNVEKYLRQCLDSIVNQTYRNLEIILVDDGSPDNCGAICDDYAAIDPRIKVIHQKNGGLSAARNAGLDIMTGDYVAFVDSDDYIDLQMLELLLQAAAGANADMAMCSLSRFGEGITVQNKPSPVCDESLTQIQFVEKLLEPQNWYYCVAWNKLYKKQIFKAIRYPAGYIHEDEAVIHRVAAQCDTVVTMAQPLYYYRQVAGSIMGSGVSARKMDKLMALADRIQFSAQMDWEGLHRSAVQEYVYSVLKYTSLFQRDDENRVYFQRMRDSLKMAKPYIMRCPAVSFRSKVCVRLAELCPALYRAWVKLRQREGSG